MWLAIITLLRPKLQSCHQPGACPSLWGPLKSSFHWKEASPRVLGRNSWKMSRNCGVNIKIMFVIISCVGSRGPVLPLPPIPRRPPIKVWEIVMSHSNPVPFTTSLGWVIVVKPQGAGVGVVLGLMPSGFVSNFLSFYLWLLIHRLTKSQPPLTQIFI